MEEIHEIDEMSIVVVLLLIVDSMLRRDTSRDTRVDKLRRRSPRDRDRTLKFVAPIAQIAFNG
jgi:hypothetical protein